MADPLTWLIGGAILSVAGIATGATAGVIGGVEQHKQARQAAQNAEDNARMQQQQLEYNKRMEEREVAALEAETAENVRRQRLQSEQLKAQQIAMLGKSGAAMSAGSPLAVLGQSAADEELMIQDTHYAGARSVAAHKVKVADYGYGASIAGQNVRAAKAARPTSTALGATMAGEIGGAGLKIGSVGVSLATGMQSVKK